MMPIHWSEEEADREQDTATSSCSLPASSSHEEITAGARSPLAGSEPRVARHTGAVEVLRTSLGFESGLDKRFDEAPAFYWLYTLLIVTGAGVLLIPRVPLVYVSVLSQVVNGIVLPFVLIFMLLLTNDRELMGEHVNSRSFNIVAWTTVVIMILLTVVLAIRH